MRKDVEQRKQSLSLKDKDDIHGLLETSDSESGSCTHAGGPNTLTNEARHTAPETKEVDE